MLTLYTDAGCESAVGASVSLGAYTDHTEGAQDLVFYLADIESDPTDAGGFERVDQTDPGVGSIVMSIADANPGTGQAASEYKLASTSEGLDSATAGASLSLGTSITAGASGAVAIYVRFENARETLGVNSDITLDITSTTARAIPA